jgi:hypothetical protein
VNTDRDVVESIGSFGVAVLSACLLVWLERRRRAAKVEPTVCH